MIPAEPLCISVALQLGTLLSLLLNLVKHKIIVANEESQLKTSDQVLFLKPGP